MANEMVKRSDFLPGEVVDLAEEIALTSPTDTPLITMIMAKGKVVPAKDVTVTWREKELNEDRGTLKHEGAEAGEILKSKRKTLSNICQIIEKVTAVSGTAEALDPKGIGSSFESEVDDRLKETKRDLEWYALNGTLCEETDDTPRQMAGLMNLVAESNVITTKGALAINHILDGLQKMWDSGAHGEYAAFVNASIKRKINELVKDEANARFIVENGSITNTYGIAVTRIATDFGTVDFVLDRHMDANGILILDMDEVELAELRSTFFENLPKAGDYKKGHVLNESTIKLLNSHAGAKILVTEA